ncbi:hypothetical protein ACEV9J_23910, partial [Vibrio parahaemolyticus]
MSKKKKKTSRNPSKKVSHQASIVSKPSRLTKLGGFLMGSGLLLVLLQASFNYINKGVSVSFSKT